MPRSATSSPNESSMQPQSSAATSGPLEAKPKEEPTMSRSQAFARRNSEAPFDATSGSASSQGNVFSVLERVASGAEQFLSDASDRGSSSREPSRICDMAREIERLSDITEEMERKRRVAEAANDHSAATYYRNVESDAYERTLSLRDALSAFEAGSLQDVMVQIAEAAVLVDSLNDEMTDFLRRKQERSVQRLLFSALRAIQRSVGQNLTDLGFKYMHNFHCDPWEDVDNRLAYVKQESALSRKECEGETEEKVRA